MIPRSADMKVPPTKDTTPHDVSNILPKPPVKPSAPMDYFERIFNQNRFEKFQHLEEFAAFKDPESTPK